MSLRNKFSDAEKLAVAWCGLLLTVVVFCAALVLVNYTSDKKLELKNTIAADVSSLESGKTALPTGLSEGFVLGASVTPTPVIGSDYSPTVSITPILNKITTTFKAKTKIIISGIVPNQCLNTDGNFCQANIDHVGVCLNGVCAATSLTFTVTPDANGKWNYTVPAGLEPGDYQVTIKDQNGNILEITTFTVTSSLPNTGVNEILIVVSVGVGLIVLAMLFRKSFRRNKLLE